MDLTPNKCGEEIRQDKLLCNIIEQECMHNVWYGKDKAIQIIKRLTDRWDTEEIIKIMAEAGIKVPENWED